MGRLWDVLDFKYDMWHVYYRKTGENIWKRLDSQKGYWYADPIISEWKGKKYLFTEAYNMTLSVGELAVSEWDGEFFSKPKVILRKPYHLSYPCVFCYENQLYMIPESSQNRTIELYKAQGDSVYSWKKIRTLYKGEMFADNTVVYEKGKYYVISYQEGVTEYNTHLFVLDMKQQKLQKLQTITAKKNEYRPAGKVFEKDGNTYRPLQYNINCYGEAINIQKVESIFPLKCCNIKQITMQDLEKNGLDVKGVRTHTLSVDDDLVVVDILLEGSKLLAPYVKILRKVRSVIFRIFREKLIK